MIRARGTINRRIHIIITMAAFPVLPLLGGCGNSGEPAGSGANASSTASGAETTPPSAKNTVPTRAAQKNDTAAGAGQAAGETAPQGSHGTATTASSTATTSSLDTMTLPQMEGKPAPNFNLPAVGGGKLSLSSFKGKVVLIDFWATWCMPCVHELPDLQSLYQRYGKRGLVVLGVTVPPGTESVARFRKERHLTYPMITADPRIIQDYNASSIPQTILVDRTGKTLKWLTGEPRPSAREYWPPLLEKALS